MGSVKGQALHPVQINRGEARAWLAQDSATAFAEDGQAQREQAKADQLAASQARQSAPENWKAGAAFAVDFINSNYLKPQPLTEQERAQLVDALAAALDEYVPGGTAGFETWPAWAKLATAAALVAIPRWQFLTEKWQAKNAKGKQQEQHGFTDHDGEATRRPVDTDSGQPGERENHGRATIGG